MWYGSGSGLDLCLCNGQWQCPFPETMTVTFPLFAAINPHAHVCPISAHIQKLLRRPISCKGQVEVEAEIG